MSKVNHILLLPKLPADLVRQLEIQYIVHIVRNDADYDIVIRSNAEKISAIAVMGGTPISAALMDQLPSLGMIGCYGVGYDGIDIGHAKSKGIMVSNTPGVLSDDVADIAIALMLAVYRDLPGGDAFVRSKKWVHGSYPLARKFSGSKLGLVGMGRIGAIIAKRAVAFDCEISYHARNQRDVPYRYFDDLVELARNVDTLCVITPGGNKTHHLINREVLHALGSDGIFINVARGSVVDENALISALDAGEIAGAGLDVFDAEPHVPTALIEMNQVVLQPHVGSATYSSHQAIMQLVMDNIAAYFAGEPLLTSLS